MTSDLPQLGQMAVAMAIGAVVGIERQYMWQRDRKESGHVVAAGVRTFTLFALAGAVSAILTTGLPYAFALPGPVVPGALDQAVALAAGAGAELTLLLNKATAPATSPDTNEQLRVHCSLTTWGGVNRRRLTYLAIIFFRLGFWFVAPATVAWSSGSMYHVELFLHQDFRSLPLLPARRAAVG